MPKIRDDVVRAVLDRARIEDVVGEFVTLRKAGVNMTGICPFHDDKHDGNFIVRPSTISEKNHGNTYRCFVCDAKGGPVQFLMNAERMTFPDAIRWLGRKYCVEVDDVPVNWTPPPPRPTPPPPPVLEIPRSWVRRTMDLAVPDKILFLYWLWMLPWSEQQRARLSETLWTYCVGGWRDGRVVFWGIDHEGVPRAAKLMRYVEDGHRDKTQHPGWIYNQEGCREVCDPDNHTILKPLFGAHLLKRYPDAIVNIVESEKTALVMANYYGNHDSQIWMACGGLKFLQLDSLQPLIDQGRTIWLWPDKDGREAWQEVCDKLGYDKCRVYTNFFDTCWREEDGDKADVADIAIRMMRTGDKPRQTTGDGQGATERDPRGTWRNGANPAPTSDTIQRAIDEWKLAHHNDEPFLDEIEMADPRVRMWRDTLRQRYNFAKTRKQKENFSNSAEHEQSQQS